MYSVLLSLEFKVQFLLGVTHPLNYFLWVQSHPLLPRSRRLSRKGKYSTEVGLHQERVMERGRQKYKRKRKCEVALNVLNKTYLYAAPPVTIFNNYTKSCEILWLM